jgi:hypothetical protein
MPSPPYGALEKGDQGRVLVAGFVQQNEVTREKRKVLLSLKVLQSG